MTCLLLQMLDCIVRPARTVNYTIGDLFLLLLLC